jgi:hypothetical protein
MLRACVADTLVLAVMPEAAPTAGWRREDAYSDGPSLGWSAGPRLGNRAFSFSTEFAVQAPEALAHHGD